jgi:hypothetical protein
MSEMIKIVDVEPSVPISSSKISNRIEIPGIKSKMMTAKLVTDLPDTIFCIIIEYLDWYEMGETISYSKTQSPVRAYSKGLEAPTKNS